MKYKDNIRSFYIIRKIETKCDTIVFLITYRSNDGQIFEDFRKKFLSKKKDQKINSLCITEVG